MSIDINKEGLIDCEEQALFLPDIECESCEQFQDLLDSLQAQLDYLRSIMQKKLTAGAGIEIEDEIISALMNPSNTYTKAEVLSLTNDIREDMQPKLTAGTDISIDGTTINHKNSGVTAASKGDTSNQTPAFGGTFKALSGTVNARGHLTAFADHTVKIPNTAATQSAAGLMSAADKKKLDGIATEATKNSFSMRVVEFSNASAVTIQAANVGTLVCNNGTEPSGYTYAGTVGFNTSNVNLPAATVNKDNIRVINLSGGTYTVPANAASVTRLYIKFT